MGMGDSSNMQGWTRNATTDATNEELRRFRKELTRAEGAPLRIIVAGDPTKPVLTFTIPRRLPRTLVAATLLGCAAAFLGGWHHAAPPGASFLDSGARATAMVEARVFDEPRAAAEAPEAQEEVEPSTAQPSSPLQPSAAAPAAEPAHAAKAADVPFVMTAAPPKPAAAHFSVEISNTGKMFEVTLAGLAGEPDDESYRTLRHELRCQRTGAENPIDPRLIDLLHQIAVRTGERIQIVSAFRAPLFPRDLNYHVRGMAADIRVPGLKTEELRDLARSLGATGVGYYPTVQFVHVDVRETPYFWTDTSGHNDNHQHDATSGDGDGVPAASGAPSAAAPAVDLLPGPGTPPALPVRTPAQNAADRLGLGQ
jgi:uncharacterized protein YcbK (DUF882 family)